MKKLIIVLFILCSSPVIFGQEQVQEEPKPIKYHVGFGIGMDYGGFGGRFTVLPAERLGIFGALGYNLLGLGFNAGANFRISPQKQLCPYIGAMYGYNAVIKVTGDANFEQTYYGPSFNFGLEFWSSVNPRFFNLELLLPIRTSAYYDDYKYLKNDLGVKFAAPTIPVGITLGYHFAF
ncbi:MAG TPA: hypothetical protein DEO60_09170 [Bacteroidales bacterium]|jgi:hypothetical protein|nr:hypothetical protein [Bacteroidales bacterium]HBZ21287.1 hypothetical protein [Bacteroidales bacterium]